MSLLPAERLEQAFERLDVRYAVAAHQIRLAGHDELGPAIDFRNHLLCHLDRFDHQRVHRRSRLLELGDK